MQQEINFQEEEIWEAIEGFKGLYEASNLGRIRSLDRVVRLISGIDRISNGKILKTPKSPKLRYLQVSLSKNGYQCSKSVHRYIAKAFIPNPHNLPMINHIDGDRFNNSVSNLEWCTQKQNIRHAIDNGLIKTLGNSNRAKPILQIDILGNVINEFSSITEAGNYLNKKRGLSNISKCVTKHTESAYGYAWVFKSEFNNTKSL